ncbi:hypothetical protein FRC08_012951 [Ceratobasidium sp. 394]|nr:hypothetical protein FRC08_012951 [Ceratobasidium sp. 394]
MILGIGVDICHIPRVARLVQKPRFAARILSPTEAHCFANLDDDARRAQFLAVRWAVKESAYKALYPHYRLQWKQVNFLPPSDHNKPILSFNDPAGAYDRLKLHASVSHDGEYIFATVLAEQ